MAITKTINKKNYTFRFSMLTIYEFCQLRKVEFSEFDNVLKDDPINAILDLFSRAIHVGTGGKIDLNRYEIDAIIDSMDNKDVSDIYGEYIKSMTTLITALPMNDTKKK